VLLLIGVAGHGAVVAGGPAADEARAAARTVAAAAGAVLALGLAGSFLAQLLAFNLSPDPLLPDARLLLAQPWGRAWTVQLGLALATTALLAVPPSWRAASTLGIPCVVALSFAPAFGGHAGAESRRALAIALDGAHVLAAGAWLGTLAVMSACTRWSEPEAGTALLYRIRRLSPLALVSAAVVAATGVGSSWMRIAGGDALLASPYVRWLALKVALFAGVLALGWLNWRRGTPRLAWSGDARVVRASVACELLVALCVVGATAALVSTSPPGE
jgi:putative copper resistance protein D